VKPRQGKAPRVFIDATRYKQRLPPRGSGVTLATFVPASKLSACEFGALLATDFGFSFLR
jgi:hypothetical protein